MVGETKRDKVHFFRGSNLGGILEHWNFTLIRKPASSVQLLRQADRQETCIYSKQWRLASRTICQSQVVWTMHKKLQEKLCQ